MLRSSYGWCSPRLRFQLVMEQTGRQHRIMIGGPSATHSDVFLVQFNYRFDEATKLTEVPRNVGSQLF